MSNQGNILTGAASPLTPPPGTPVASVQPSANVNANVIVTVPSIEHIMIVKSNITWTKELNDTNWNV